MAANSPGRAWGVLPGDPNTPSRGFFPVLKRSEWTHRPPPAAEGEAAPRREAALGHLSQRSSRTQAAGTCGLSSTRATGTSLSLSPRILGLRAPLGVVKSFPTSTPPPPNMVREPCSVPEAVPGAVAGQGALNQSGAAPAGDSRACLGGDRKGRPHR